jgi:hypothetical protein
LFLVEKVPLNCTSAIKSLLHASVNSLSTIVQNVHCIFHTRRTFFLSFCCPIVEKMLYATRAKSVIALDVLSHSPAALGTIFTSRATIIHFLHFIIHFVKKIKNKKSTILDIHDCLKHLAGQDMYIFVRLAPGPVI